MELLLSLQYSQLSQYKDNNKRFSYHFHISIINQTEKKLKQALRAAKGCEAH